MPNDRRPNVAGATYFITQVTYQREPWLCQEIGRRALREAIIQRMALGDLPKAATLGDRKGEAKSSIYNRCVCVVTGAFSLPIDVAAERWKLINPIEANQGFCNEVL